MQISPSGLRLVERFENIYESRYCPYWDAYGHVWTRGFGETDWNGNFGGRCISHSQAEANLKRLVDNDYAPAINALGVPLSQNQFDALCSFVWNLGPGSMQWDVGRSLRARQYYQAANEMLQYRFAGGVELSGLRERRYAERALFLSAPAPKPKPKNPLDVLERSERIRYDSYKKHHRPREKRELILMRKNIYEAATHGRLFTDKHKKVKKGWNINHRYPRYQLLKKITE